MADYLVGDIQGCFKELKFLLKKVKFNPKCDVLWPVGDLIGRGPNSLAVMEHLLSLGNSVKAVLGNHDLHFLAIHYGYARQKNKDKLDKLLQSDICPDVVAWMRTQKLLRQLDDKTFVCHAGIYPGWSTKQALALAKEFEHLMESDKFTNFLSTMHGDDPAQWSEDLWADERYRFIVNAFTRMRFCHKDGSLDFANKLSPEHTDPTYVPWFLCPSQLKKKQRIIFGHWAALMGDLGDTKHIGLDTGCVWGHQLTMIRWQDKARFTVDKFN